jgi:uncharacterized protein YcbK (DUF882 family)
MNDDFLWSLETMRERLQRPVFITSGFRCPEHNKQVGGSPRSYHLKGQAADVACANASERFQLIKAAIVIGFSGIGIDKTYVHLDNRRDLPSKIWTY